jgi:chitosanase
MNKDFIQRIVNVWETGKEDFNVSTLYFLDDGPGDIKQITIGSGITEWGNLKTVVSRFSVKKPEHRIGDYIHSIGKISLVDCNDFMMLLKDAVKTKEWKDSYTSVFDEAYWTAAKKFFSNNLFSYDLSMLVIYDSFLQSGGMRKEIRNRFREVTPINGGNEKEWIFQYLNARKNWLTNHSNRDVINSVYRVKDMLRELNEENWSLENPVKANGAIVLPKKL